MLQAIFIRRKADVKKAMCDSPQVPAASPSHPFPDAPVDQSSYVQLDVGGTVFMAARATIMSEPSKLSEWAASGFRMLPRNASGVPFVDRDPDSFRFVLSYLRGYTLNLEPEVIGRIAEDAAFYRLEGMTRAIGLSAPDSWKFVAGPGVSKDRKVLSTNAMTALCGDAFQTEGAQEMHFKVDKCDSVDFGVVTPGSWQHDKSFYGADETIALSSNGDISIKLPIASEVPHQQLKFKEHDVVAVHFCHKADGTLVRFSVNSGGSYECVLKPPAPALRIACYIHGVSVVQVVAPEK